MRKRFLWVWAISLAIGESATYAGYGWKRAAASAERVHPLQQRYFISR
jgi:hypothetical protein